MSQALEATGAGVVASFVMAGGVLTGKYDAGETGRSHGELDDPRLMAARDTGRRLRALSEELRVPPAALAIAFALANPVVASVLFGATSPAQIAENVRAPSLDAAVAARVAEVF
jgi:aryl-alcohol dehydrogenase-like predicted oxidoreductase